MLASLGFTMIDSTKATETYDDASEMWTHTKKSRLVLIIVLEVNEGRDVVSSTRRRHDAFAAKESRSNDSRLST